MVGDQGRYSAVSVFTGWLLYKIGKTIITAKASYFFCLIEYGWQRGCQWKSSEVLYKLILMGIDTWGEIDENCCQPRSSSCRNKCYLFIKTMVHPRGRKCMRLGFSSWVPGLSPANGWLRALGKSPHFFLLVLSICFYWELPEPRIVSWSWELANHPHRMGHVPKCPHGLELLSDPETNPWFTSACFFLSGISNLNCLATEWLLEWQNSFTT